LVNTTVSGNVSESYGGGIENFVGTLVLTNSTVTGNTAGLLGGGILNSSGTLYLTDSTVSENRTLDSGGGISNVRYYRYHPYPPAVAILTDTTVSGNTAQYQGGGIQNFESLTLTSSTVSGNSALQGDGGGIIAYGTLTVTSSTVSDNTAVSGGGISSFTYDPALATIKNSIVADNGVDNCAGSTSSLGFNLTDDTSCGFADPTDLFADDAMLFPLQDNGGPTETHALRSGSLAIDAGGPDCPPTDQRGVARPDGTCDIGAFELGAAEVPVLGVEIDLKPGSDPNCVNPDATGLVAVITLGNADLDVRDIVEATLEFGGAIQAQSCDLGDQKGMLADGFEDLTCHFERMDVTWPAVGSDCGDVSLMGELADGTPIEGVDRACLAGEPTCGTKRGGRGGK
jgi:hypothetical protein